MKLLAADQARRRSVTAPAALSGAPAAPRAPCARRLRALTREFPAISFGAADLTIAKDYLGRGYGYETEQGRAARALLADLEGIELETTYTAKCMAAFLALAAEPPYRNQNLLFWNTYSSIDPAASLPVLPEFGELPPEFHRFFVANRGES